MNNLLTHLKHNMNIINKKIVDSILFCRNHMFFLVDMNRFEFYFFFTIKFTL